MRVRYFLGIDTGGTKSHALIANEEGCAVGFAEGGPGNPQGIGYPALTQLFSIIVNQAVAHAGISISDIAGAGFGIGGYDWSSERVTLLESIAPLGLRAQIEIVNDTTLGILAGATEGWGVAVVSGTGCNCRGWDRQHREGRVIGNGYLVAEGAGASELVVKAIQAIALEWTRRGPATQLTAAFSEHFGYSNREQLMEYLTNSRDWGKISAAAPVVFQVAAQGDVVAGELIPWAGRELASLAIGVIRQLELEAESFDVVLVGSVFNGSPLVIETMDECVRAVAPRARLVRLATVPAVGAVMLGMQQAGVDAIPLRENLMRTTNHLHQE